MSQGLQQLTRIARVDQVPGPGAQNAPQDWGLSVEETGRNRKALVSPGARLAEYSVTTHLWIPPCQVTFDRMRMCDRMRTFIRPQRCGDLMTAGRYGDACPETGPNQVQELTAR